jgi:hypothetical protein
MNPFHFGRVWLLGLEVRSNYRLGIQFHQSFLSIPMLPIFHYKFRIMGHQVFLIDLFQGIDLWLHDTYHLQTLPLSQYHCIHLHLKALVHTLN